MAEEKEPFRVIIVGGGVAGLTLANSLQRAKIDYLLLEARNEVAPPAGASIAIGANGARILDQIGALDEVLDVSTSSDFFESYRDGKLFDQNDFLKLNHARSGYSVNFLNRQTLLQILYGSVPDKRKILVGKRVSEIDYSQDGVVVHCKDSTLYSGSVVVGADGVHSMVRQEMWRHMEIESPGAVSHEEKHKMTAEYSCMYGVSKPVRGLSQGILYKTYGEDVSFLTAVGKQDRVFWFIFQKLDQKYTIPNIPQFASEEAQAQALKVLARPITDRVVFRDIWEKRESCLLAPLEEAFFTKWTWGSFACVGDSAHKWTPNIGQGGNNAIESAAALANTLHRLVNQAEKSGLPSSSTIALSLDAFQSHRQARAEATFEIACKVTRLEALKGPVEKFLALYLFPNSGELLANKLAAASIGSEKLDFLPDPERSLTGSMAFNQRYGVGREDNLLQRAAFALPLLIIGYLCHTGVLVDIAPSITDTTQRQSLSLLTTMAPILLICLFESHRRANALTTMRFPLLFGIATQFLGVGSITPLYFFLHYIQSPVSGFAAFDQRLLNVAAASTALPALVLASGLPALALYVAPDLSMRGLWQLFPAALSLVHYLLQKFAVRDTTKLDRIYGPFTDLPHIRFAVRVLAATSALAFNWVRWLEFSQSPIFVHDGKYAFTLACFIWLGLLFKDLKDAEIVPTAWSSLLSFFLLCTFVCGPGAAMALGWLWREEMLASKRAAGAVVRKG